MSSVRESAERPVHHRALALILLSAVASCRSWATDQPAERGYTLVLIKTGPKSGQLSKEDNDKVFAGHFANMERMANERQLVVAGPFGNSLHDDALRGLFIFDTAKRTEAESWAHTDPPTQAGVFVLEFHDLATKAPLPWALEQDLAKRAQKKADGKTPKPGDGARNYVLLTAENIGLARRELAPLNTSEGGVYLLGRLDDVHALAILDAQNVDEARKRFGPRLEHIGAYTLDDWFASEQLAHLFLP